MERHMHNFFALKLNHACVIFFTGMLLDQVGVDFIALENRYVTY